MEYREAGISEVTSHCFHLDELRPTWKGEPAKHRTLFDVEDRLGFGLLRIHYALLATANGMRFESTVFQAPNDPNMRFSLLEIFPAELRPTSPKSLLSATEFYGLTKYFPGKQGIRAFGESDHGALCMSMRWEDLHAIYLWRTPTASPDNIPEEQRNALLTPVAKKFWTFWRNLRYERNT